MSPKKPAVPRISDATWILVHADDRTFASDSERGVLCANPAWRTFVTAGTKTEHALDTIKFLDAAVLFARPDPDLAWSLARRFQHGFPARPAFIVLDAVEHDDLARATISGITTVVRDDGLRTTHSGLRYRLHGGVYHRVGHLIGDHDLSIRQYQCLLLAAAQMPHRDIALKLEIQRSSIREHLREARRKIGIKTVDELLRKTREQARAEAAIRIPR